MFHLTIRSNPDSSPGRGAWNRKTTGLAKNPFRSRLARKFGRGFCPLTFSADRLMNTDTRPGNTRMAAGLRSRDEISAAAWGRKTRPKRRNFTAASALNFFSTRPLPRMAAAPAPKPWRLLSAHTRQGDAEIDLQPIHRPTCGWGAPGPGTDNAGHLP